MSEETMIVRKEGRAGRLTFNREKALNALDFDMAMAIERALVAWRDDPEVEIVVIDAAGPFELNDLCAAAANLCDLIDAAPEGRSFDWRVVTVHAQALRLLLTLPAEAADARAKVLDSLKDVLKAKVPGAGEPEA